MLQAPQTASMMAVPDVSLDHLEQLPPSSAEQPVGAAGMLLAPAERGMDTTLPESAAEGPPVGPAAKDNALPPAENKQPGDSRA